MNTGESPRVRLQNVAGTASDIDRDELRELYKLAVDEYHFEVSLNSQRTQYYLTLNVATIAAATGLLKVGGETSRPFVAIVFVLGTILALLAHKAIKKGHEYYRQTIYKKTLIEHLLGRLQQIDGYSYAGANLAMATTRGMSESATILDNPDAWIHRDSGQHTVTTSMLRIMKMFAATNVFALILLATYEIIRFI